MPARLKAILLLTWAVIVTALRRLFGGGRQGIAAFRANYDADRLPPVSAEERELLGTMGRCIACGLCDRGESERISSSSGEYRGVMAIVLAGSRSMPDYGAAALSLRHVGQDVLRDKEQLCPVDVPIARLARFIQDKASELKRSLPPGP